MAETAVYPATIAAGMLERKHWEAMGSASWFFSVLISCQTDPEGRVLYGAPRSYRWYAEKMGGMSARTLRWYSAKLAKAGYIEKTKSRDGIVVRILNQKKFSSKTGAAEATTREGRAAAAPGEVRSGGNEWQRPGPRKLTRAEREDETMRRLAIRFGMLPGGGN